METVRGASEALRSKFSFTTITTNSGSTSPPQPQQQGKQQQQPQQLLTTTITEAPQAIQAWVSEVVMDAHGLARVCATEFWWSLPSVLCLVPLYTYAMWQTTPATPDIWKLVNLDFVWRLEQAVGIVAAFLASNASYFLAAAYLWTKNTVSTTTTTTTSKSGSTESIDEANGSSLVAKITTIPPALGWWIFSAGCMSTLFHTVQAVGDYGVAEALCYLDHGVAGTAVLYYWWSCGRPSPRAIICAVAGLVALSIPAAWCPPAYPGLHSVWHALSAIAAVLWARDSCSSTSSSSSLLH